jgi:hypothetical protein
MGMRDTTSQRRREMIASRNFCNVTILNSSDDDGITCTFATAREAADCADWARAEGAWFVQVWS